MPGSKLVYEARECLEHDNPEEHAALFFPASFSLR